MQHDRAEFKPLDPGRIHVGDPVELAWWCAQLHCSPQQLTGEYDNRNSASVGLQLNQTLYSGGRLPSAHRRAMALRTTVRSTAARQRFPRFDLPAGRSLAGRYVVVRPLGSGYEGEVYAVMDTTEVRMLEASTRLRCVAAMLTSRSSMPLL